MQGVRLENWWIIRKQQARENGQNQSERKEILDYRGGEDERDIRMASSRTAKETIDISNEESSKMK